MGPPHQLQMTIRPLKLIAVPNRCYARCMPDIESRASERRRTKHTDDDDDDDSLDIVPERCLVHTIKYGAGDVAVTRAESNHPTHINPCISCGRPDLKVTCATDTVHLVLVYVLTRKSDDEALISLLC
jgi:hypothetical protein